NKWESPPGDASEIPLPSSSLYLLGSAEEAPNFGACMALKPSATRQLGDPLRRKRPVGSLTEAVYLSNGNAGVLRSAQWGQKPLVEQNLF
ncbi:hypothetical protein NPIL_645371, partial [Nephila pilipes]